MRALVLAGMAMVVALPLSIVGVSSAETWPRPFDPDRLANEIPEPMLSAYLDAGQAWEIDWALLAAIGKIECDHGRYAAPGCWPPGTINYAGARGPMQFLGSTWRHDAGTFDLDVAGPPAADGVGYAIDGDGDGIADPWSPYDAVHAAARFLVDLGGRDAPAAAARGYFAGPANPDPQAGADYAARAVALIAEYHRLAGPGGPGSPTVAVVQDGHALPFARDGLYAVAADRQPPRDPEWQLVRPHHSGRVAVDVALQAGTPVYALVDATVTRAGPAGDCGNRVVLGQPAQHATITYCHLSHMAVSAGQTVTAGTPIGRSGGQPGTPGAGSSTGPHLHLHIDTPSGRRCPQALLLGLWRRWPVPTIAGLRTSGCTHHGATPAEHSPVPVPPDLPIPSTPHAAAGS